jgi:hypothetical protein
MPCVAHVLVPMFVSLLSGLGADPDAAPASLYQSLERLAPVRRAES